MARIKQLSSAEAQKIAAGEVVERPANVVKELIENSLDAQATSISVYIKDGGKELIRIVDNGCGMSREDAHLCFAHHATSKITSVDDLDSISTFGFRGEALSSICAVSKVTLITKHADDQLGTRLELEQTQVISESEIPAPNGTDITISDLFYNVPARKKFLKTRETEWRQIQLLMQAFCLDYQSIHFKLYHDDKLILNCAPTQDIMQRIAQLHDQQFVASMIEIQKSTSAGITISGAISNHHFYKYDRSSIFFFVNSRWVKNQKLGSALLKGYLNVLPAGRFPAAFIFIQVDPTAVDINIHPRKEEVQFLHPRMVEQLISSTTKEALERNLSAQFKKEVTIAPAPQINFDSSSFHRVSSAPHPMTFSPKPDPVAFFDHPPFVETPEIELTVARTIDDAFAPLHQPSAVEFTQPEEQIKALESEKNYELIGQYHKTYLLLQKEEGLYVIDQHAAHERILYEKFAGRFEDVAQIKLMFPLMIHLGNDDLALLEPHLAIMQTNGIDVEVFGNNQLLVNATPVHLKNVNLQELVQEMVGWIKDMHGIDSTQFIQAINEKLHAQMACKAAIKAGDTLTHEQMHQLIEDLEKTNNRFTCPHGRPTGWLLSLYEIEKKFKRKI